MKRREIEGYVRLAADEVERVSANWRDESKEKRAEAVGGARWALARALELLSERKAA